MAAGHPANDTLTSPRGPCRKLLLAPTLGPLLQFIHWPASMTRPKIGKTTSFAYACRMRAAEKLREAVKKPAILSLADLRHGLEPLRATRQVYVQFCGDEDKCVQFATVSRFRYSLKQIAQYPEKGSAYLVTSTKRETLDAWPIIWQGAVGPKYLLVAYVDPVRYGFKSRAKTFVTIGPLKPMPIDQRKRGLWIIYDFVRRTVIFEPMMEGDFA